MKFDTFSFFIGFVVAVILGLIYNTLFPRKSFYDSIIFTDAMSMEEAKKLLDTETEKLQIQYQELEKNGAVSEEAKKKYQDDLVKISTDFAQFMNKKSITSEEATPPPPPVPPPSPPATTSTYVSGFY
jgi:hypothetical protein